MFHLITLFFKWDVTECFVIVGLSTTLSFSISTQFLD